MATTLSQVITAINQIKNCSGLGPDKTYSLSANPTVFDINEERLKALLSDTFQYVGTTDERRAFIESLTEALAGGVMKLYGAEVSGKKYYLLNAEETAHYRRVNGHW